MIHSHQVVEVVGIVSLGGTIFGHALYGLSVLFGWPRVKTFSQRLIAVGTDIKKICFPPEVPKPATPPPSEGSTPG